MSKLPDFEGLAIFAKVAEMRSFAGAAQELALSKATVSKAVTRLELRLGARLFNRTSRRLALTDAGQRLLEPASAILAQGEAAEDAALEQSKTPRGLVRLAAPMSFGLRCVAPILPDFLGTYPQVSIDLHLSDETVDLIGEGIDLALRIGALPDSSMVARRLCPVRRLVVGAPAYFARRGRPTHPAHLAEHDCLGYAYLATADVWRFTNAAGEESWVRPAGPMRANNADALTPALIAGLGLALQPDFIVEEALASGALEAVLTDWAMRDASLHLVSPSAGPRPARVSVLADFLVERLAKGPGSRESRSAVTI
ncbi:MAG: LysR family transcriptional regulator [Caulobacteraceae bacterium]|nr:LysR family transcriptional regulator [Caulobacteraceae bacterium]